MRLKEIRKNRNISQTNLAQIMGVTRATIANYESGARFPSQEVLLKLADVLNVTVDNLLGREPRKIPENAVPADMNDLIKIPVLGYVRAGVGGHVEQEIIGFENTAKDSVKDGEHYFWLKVTGNSMAPKIDDGDYVLIRHQVSVDSGDLAVVLVDGEEGVVKKVLYGDDWIELHSFNPYFPPRRFEGENVLEIMVIGKVIEQKRKY